VVWELPEQTTSYPKKFWLQPGGNSMSLIIYLVGFAFVIGGIAWALIVVGVTTLYVMIATVILIGVAILTGVTRTRSKD
jgi:amino acid transporter